MPQARGRNKGKASNRQQNSSDGRNEPAGRTGGKNAAKLQQKGANAHGQRGMQGARSQRVNNQKNMNNLPAQQREREEYGSVRDREFTESYESDADQPRVGRGKEGHGGYDNQPAQSGRAKQAKRISRSQSRQSQSRGGQTDREAMEAQGGYGPPSGKRNDQNREGWGERGGRNAGENKRGRGSRDGEGGFENARGEYANFNGGSRPRDEDSELNDYTDSRLGSNARRGSKSTGRSMQTRPTARKGGVKKGAVNKGTSNKSKGSSTRRQTAGRGNRGS